MADQSGTTGGLLDFFVLEAADYLEQLDRSLSQSAGADPESILRLSRALRGSATMARLPDFPELAAAFEKVARGLRDGTVPLDERVRSAMVAAVDDMKALLHRVRSWGPDESRAARTRAAELASLAPETPQPRLERSIASGSEYLAGELSNLGAGLELLLTSPAAESGMDQVLQRVRTLRGVAGIRDLPRLPDVLDAAERALEGAQRGARSAAETGRGLLEASAALLRNLATAMRAGGAPAVADEVRSRFEDAFEAWENTEASDHLVVPVGSLFPDDGGPGVVSAASNPPGDPQRRFVVEAVGRAEHLLQVIADARPAVAGGDAHRAARPIRSALRSLRQTAESFSMSEFAESVGRLAGELTMLDTDTLDRLQGVAQQIIARGPDAEVFAGLEQGLPSIPEERGAEPLAEPPAVPEPAVMNADTPSVSADFTSESLPEFAPEEPPSLRSMLDRGIGSLDMLADRPLADAAPVEETPVVPVEYLLYRGRAALDRAIEIRQELAQRGGGLEPDEIEEIFDLIDLARAS